MGWQRRLGARGQPRGRRARASSPAKLAVTIGSINVDLVSATLGNTASRLQLAAELEMVLVGEAIDGAVPKAIAFEPAGEEA